MDNGTASSAIWSSSGISSTRFFQGSIMLAQVGLIFQLCVLL